MLSGQGRGNGQAKKQSPTVTRVKADTTKGQAKAAAKAETRAAKAEAQGLKDRDQSRAKDGNRRDDDYDAGTEITPTTPTTRPVKNPKLEARLQGMLPADTTVQDAMAGFKNWGQFVAAVHVSNNLNIPFADLKAKMTGITPGPTPGTTIQGTPMSLGQAIQSLKGTSTVPETQPLTTTTIQTEVKKAEDAAGTDLRRTRDRS